MRIELAVEPDFARQIGISEIADHRAPDAEVDRTVDLLRHRLNDRHRQSERIATGEAARPPRRTACAGPPPAISLAPPLSGIGGPSFVSPRLWRRRSSGRFVGDARPRRTSPCRCGRRAPRAGCSSATAAPEASPSRMSRSTQRRKPDLFEQHAVPGFGRDVAGLRMRKRVGAQLCSGATAAVQTKPSSRTGMRCRRAASVAPRMAASSRPPKRRGDGERVGERRDMARERRHRSRARLRAKPSSSTPVPRPAQRAPPPPNKAAAMAASRGGVADAHFAEANQIAVRRHRVVAGRHSGEEFLLGHCRLLGEIGGRRFERQRNDAQFRAGAASPAG